MLGESYHDYTTALDTFGLESLHARRHIYALNWLEKLLSTQSTLNGLYQLRKLLTQDKKQDKFCPVYAMHTRFKNSPISYLTNLLNSDNMK